MYYKLKIIWEKSLPKWSKTIHVIENKKSHSYVLDNGKTYKYYELQKVDNAETSGKEKEIKTEHTRESVLKNNKIKKIFTRENIDTSKIITTERQRNIRPELQKLLSR